MKKNVLVFSLVFVLIFNAIAQVEPGHSIMKNGKFPTDLVYGYNAFDPSGTLPQGPLKFVLGQPNSVVSLAPTVSGDYLSSGCWGNGVWYAGEYSSNISNLWTINPITGAMSLIGPIGFIVSGLTYDYTTMNLYAINVDYINSNTNLYIINPATGAANYVGSGNFIGSGLGCDLIGQLYTIDNLNGNLLAIDKTNGSASVIGPLGIIGSDNDDLEFDYSDNTMYLSSYIPAVGGQLRTIDLTTGTSTIVGSFQGGSEVTALAIPNQPTIFQNDVGVIAVVNPVSSTTLGATEVITVTIRNFGTAPQSNFPVQFTVNGSTPVINMFNGLIAPGANLNFTFTTTADMSAYGSYTIVACTGLQGDQNPANDCKTAVVQKIMPYWTDTIWPQNDPYWTGTTDGNTITQSSLINFVSGDVEAGWAKFDITNIPDNTQINTLELHYYVNSQSGSPALQINRLNADPLIATPSVVFNQIQTGTNYLVTNNGFSPGWHSLTMPASAKTDLSVATLADWFALGFYEPDNCPACFTGSVEGWNESHRPYLVVEYGYIPSPSDVGVFSITSPSTGNGLTANEPIQVTLKNYGTFTQNSIPVSATITGPGGVVTFSAVYPGPLAAGATTGIPFVIGNADFHFCGNYSITACTNLAGDGFANNNCKTKNITNSSALVVTGLTSPLSGSGLGSSEQLSVNLMNIGNTTVFSSLVSYSINGGIPISVNFIGPLASGASTAFILGLLDLHMFGTYTIQICTGSNCGCFTFQVTNSIPTVSDTFWPQNLPNWTGSTDGVNFTQNNLIAINSHNAQEGWAKFDINAMPVGVLVNSVRLHYYTQSQTANPNFRIKRLLIDPMTNNPQNVMTAIINGNTYINATGGSAIGWHDYILGNTAITDLMLQAGNTMGQKWFATSFYNYDTCTNCSTAVIEGWNSINIPYLVVHYTPPINHDVGVTSINIDTTYFIAGPYMPTAVVKNYGIAAETFAVTATATGGYSSTITISTLQPGQSIQVFFSNWNPPVGPICVDVTTQLATDGFLNNNHLQLCWDNIIAPNVSGTVTYNNSAGTIMNDSTVVLLVRVNPPGMIKVDTVDANGNYLFTNVASGTYYMQAVCEKTWGGGNASDGLAVLKHFVGMTLLTGLNLKAADANGDLQVNSIDALMILHRFLWLITTFPVGDWVSEQPFVNIPLTQFGPVNLKVQCTGDVNGSFTP